MREIYDIKEFFNIYREPCNNCELFTEGCICEKGHRQKKVIISTGHIPELTYRRKGGCPDWTILISKTDSWWGEEPPYRCSGVYGGSKTSILG